MTSQSAQALQSDPHLGYRVLNKTLGMPTDIPGWPPMTLEGLFTALEMWTLDPYHEMPDDDYAHPHRAYQKPYRCLAWARCKIQPIENSHRKRFVGTEPLYPENKFALSYGIFFLHRGYSCRVDTDDPLLIAKLDRLIAVNMARQEFIDNQMPRKGLAC